MDVKSVFLNEKISDEVDVEQPPGFESRNMSYLSEFKELNGRYVAFGGNPKGGKISSKGKIKTVLLRVPKENNMYNVNLKNIVPSEDLTCLFVKAIIDESNLWKRRLAHINSKTINKLVKGNLVRGLPTKVFENNNTCVACKKGKQHRASCKTKPVSSVDQPLFRLHMDLFGPTFVKSLHKKNYCLVITDDYSSLKVKVIISDNGNEFKNSDLNQFCSMKGIKREISVPRTPQQNGICERKNKSLIEAARTMLADLLLPIPFWAEAFNKHDIDAKKPESEVILSPSGSAQSRKQDDQTKKEAKGKSHVESFIGHKDLSVEFKDCSENNSNEVNAAGTIVLTIGKNTSNSSNPYSASSPSNTTASPTYGKSSFINASQLSNDLDMPELEDITYSDDENDVGAEADFNNLETYITEEPKRVHQALKDPSWIEAMEEELLQFKMQKVWVLVDLPHRKRAIGTKWVYRNKKDERGIVVRNKARLVAQGHTQEERIDYEEVFAPVARIEAIRLFLVYASFIGFMVYQMDVKSAFPYETIEEEVYVCQPLGFEDPDLPDKVHKVVKVLGLHQAPRAWYETLANYLLENSFIRGKIDQTLFIKKQKGDILLVQIYVDDIIFGATNKDLCKYFEKLMKDKFQMSSMGELTFFFGLQVKQKKDGIFISQDKYVAEILRKFGLTEGKSANTLIDTEKPLLKDPDGEDVDVHTYRSMIGLLMYLTSSRPDIMFACKKKTVVATSSTKVEYVATASCCAQFWNTVAIKQVTDVTRLQALVNKKNVVVTEAAIREVLRLDDAEGVNYLPNEEIFTDSAMASAVICLSTGDLSTHTTKYASPTLTQKVFANMRRVGKGFSGVETSLFEGMLLGQEIKEVGDEEEHVEDVTASDAAQGDDTAAHGEVPTVQHTQPQSPQAQPQPQPQPQPQQAADFPMSLLKEALDTCTALTRRVEHLKYNKVAQALEITKLKRRVKKLEKGNKVRVLKLRRLKRVGTSQRIDTSDDTVMDDESNQGRIIDEMDKDDAVALMDNKEEDKKDEEAKEDEPAEVQEVVDVVTTDKRRKGVVIRDPEEESTTSSIIPVETKSKDNGIGIMVEEPKPLKKKKQIEIDEEYARKLHAELNKDINWDVAIDHVNLKAKEDPNVASFRLDYFKGMSYDDIRPIIEAKFNSNVDLFLKTKEQMEEEESRALQRINETPVERAAKRRKLNKEVEDIKRHQEIVPDKDDDVYTEATLLARKVPVVDYKIIELNNKPYYKIIRADGTYQLHISFLTLLKNFDREDLEAL
nr:putative ribonuclease H-like domain-containing protein [Tanacetum cinerariifolium]